MFPKRHLRLPWREVDGRVVVIQTTRGEVHELDECATFLWKQADGSASIDQIVSALMDEFEIDEQTAKSDSIGFYKELQLKGLIENTESLS